MEGLTADQKRIADKVRKLLALSNGAGTEHEAATAAAAARDLVERHNLDMGVLSQPEPEAAAAGTDTFRRMPMHYALLITACEYLFDVLSFRQLALDSSGVSCFYFVGLPASVEAAVLTFHYLRDSVESLLKGRGAAIWGRSQARGYRMGVALRLAQRAQEHKENREAQGGDTAALIVVGNRVAREAMAKLGLTRKLKVNFKADKSAATLGYMDGGRVDLHGARESRMIGDGK